MGSLLLLGFFIGMRHALEADHVAAVASLATQTTSLKQAVKIGSIWGLGHTIALFLFGSLVLLTDLFIPEQAARWLEFIVGIMLILLGLDVLRRVWRDRINGGINGDDAHRQSITVSHRHSDKLSLRILFIGLLHGMAGSAALILLTLGTISSPVQGLIYIALFGAGSIVGMAVLSCIISMPLRASSSSVSWVHNGLQFVIGSATVVLGGMVVTSF